MPPPGKGNKKHPVAATPPPPVDKKTETQLLAASDYQHMFHQEPSAQVKEAGRKLMLGEVAAGGSELSDATDPLAVTAFERLPPLVDAHFRQFLGSVPRTYSLTPKRAPSSSSASSD